MTPETPLKTLPGADLRLECGTCGHGATLPIPDLTKQLGEAATLGDLQARIRCQRCGEGDPIIVIPTQAPGGTEQDIAEEHHRPRRRRIRG